MSEIFILIEYKALNKDKILEALKSIYFTKKCKFFTNLHSDKFT